MADRPMQSFQEILGVTDKEFFKRVERLANRLGKINERWNKRLVLEKLSSIREAYIDGRFEILVYKEVTIRGNQYKLIASIFSDAHARGAESCNSRVEVGDIRDRNAWKDEIMFINIVELSDALEIKVPVRARLYVIPDEICSVGEGFLYRLISRGGFKVFPKFIEGKFISPQSGSPVVEGASQVVNDITSDYCEGFWDWLFGDKGQFKTIRFCKNYLGSGSNYRNIMKVFGQRGRLLNNSVNVAIGPFDL